MKSTAPYPGLVDSDQDRSRSFGQVDERGARTIISAALFEWKPPLHLSTQRKR